MKTYSLALTGILALVASWILHGGRATVTTGGGVQPPSPQTSPSRESGALDRAPLHAVRDPVPAATQPAASPPDSPATEETAAVEGTMRGTIYGYSGEVVPHARLVFMGADSSNRGAIAWCTGNEVGEYIWKLGPGRWDVQYAGCLADRARSSTSAGTIEVQSDAVRYFDVFVPGELSIRGGFYRPDRDKSVVRLELVRPAEPTRVVAAASCTTDQRSYADAVDELELETSAVFSEEQAWRSLGGFELKNLPPDLYDLRLYMDVGRRFWVSLPVDLTQGDKEFDPLPVLEAQFLDHLTFPML